MTASCQGPASGPDKTRQSKQITLRELRFILSFHLADLVISLSPPSPMFRAARGGKCPIPTWAGWSELLAWAGSGTLPQYAFLPSWPAASFFPLPDNLHFACFHFWPDLAAWACLPPVSYWMCYGCVTVPRTTGTWVGA